MSNALDKLRVRLASEGYKSMNGENKEKIEIDEVAHDEQVGKQKRQYTRSEIQLCVMLIIALILILVLVVLIVIMHFQMETVNDCQTASCLEITGGLLKNMNTSVDPCEDFYEYSCGKWTKDRAIPPDKRKWTTFAEIYQKNSAFIKNALSAPGHALNGTNSTAIRKAKDYYLACRNTSTVEDLGNKPLLQLIKELGSWSLTPDDPSGSSQWDEDSWDFMKTLKITHSYKGNAFFSMWVSADDKNSSRNILQFDQSGLSLSSPKEYKRNSTEKLHKALIKFATRVGILLGGKSNVVQEKLEEIWQFEKELAEIFVPSENLTDPKKNYHKMTLQQLQDIVGTDWIHLGNYVNMMFNKTISSDEEILVTTPSYFTKLAKLMKKTNNKELFANYMVWNVIQNFMSYLPTVFRQAELIFTSVATGVSSESPRWEMCVEKADDVFGFATGALFVSKKFNKKDRETVISILAGLRESFINNLPSVSWMDEVTKNRAEDKAKAVAQQIGYPDWVVDQKKLDEHYKLLDVTSGEMFQNVLNAKIFFKQKNLRRYGKPPEKYEWHMSPSEVNAYYNANFNYIAFPAGILQKPFYNPTFPMSMNFGAIGMVMGHELTHAFDNSGRNYDKFGNMENWWMNSSILGFQSATACMKKQYSSYKVLGEKVNGLTTLGENIADNGGTKASFYAYQTWKTTHGIEPPLAGMNMTDDQLFWMGFSQVWCSYYQPAYAVQALITDAHSPAKYRVNGVASNSREFAKAFKCKVGTKMNPESKCKVW